MFNVGGGEVFVILLVALIVLGPAKLPDAARQIGRAMSEVRRISAGFKEELESAIDDSTEQQARERGQQLTAAPKDAQPIDEGPVRTTPLTPPGGNGANGANGAGTDHGAREAAESTDGPDEPGLA